LIYVKISYGPLFERQTVKSLLLQWKPRSWF